MWADGAVEYWVDGVLHNDNGPAIAYGGVGLYYRHGEFLYREGAMETESIGRRIDLIEKRFKGQG